jgi:NADPH2:quinone reductase
MNAIAAAMLAAVAEPGGGPLRLDRLPRPVPQAGEVLVRVRGSGVNPLDLKIGAGKAPHARHPLPAVLGIDMAGEVEAPGPGVTGFRPGDRVFGMTGGVGGIQGSLAEYAAVDARLLAPIPASLGFREAAALPLVAITAWEALVDRAALRRGQSLLVLGAAGGVGHVAVQLARALGAEVSGTAREEDAALLRRLGANPIARDAKAEDILAWTPDGRGFDVVLDTVGGPVLDAAFGVVGRFGRVVSILGWGTHSLAPLSFRGGTYSGVFTLAPLLGEGDRAHHGAILRQVAKLVDDGKLRPVLDPRRFELAAADAAHAVLAGGDSQGRVVIDLPC